MGIRDRASSATEAISDGVARSREIVGGAAGKARDAAPDLVRVASDAAVWTSQAVVDRMPYREGWERIGRLGWRIADRFLVEGSKHFTLGVPVYKIVKEELSKNKSREQPVKEKENTESQEQPGKDKKENTEFVKLKARL